MRVLVLGGGGREHALCWKIAQSPDCEALFCAPGNAGTAELASHLSLDLKDHPAVITACGDFGVDLVVVGPEAPLVDGLSDSFAIRVETDIHRPCELTDTVDFGFSLKISHECFRPNRIVVLCGRKLVSSLSTRN